MEKVLTIWPIGHSTRDIGDFLDMLRANRIGAVADVRGLPGSAKFPQFNSEVLSASLESAGIEYVHINKLGGRRRGNKNSRNTVWRNAAFRGYADYMETEGFAEGIEELVALAAQKRTAIMCAEAVWWRCHRSMIADYLKASGFTVEHIMAAGKNVVHPFTSAARLGHDGGLEYGPERPATQ